MSSRSGNPRGERLNRIIADYLNAVESGNAPDPNELIEQHSDLADDLKRFFAGHDETSDFVLPMEPEGGAASVESVLARHGLEMRNRFRSNG